MKNRKHDEEKSNTSQDSSQTCGDQQWKLLCIGNFLNEGSISREEFNPFGRLVFCDIQGSLGEMIHRLLDKKTNRKQF